MQAERPSSFDEIVVGSGLAGLRIASNLSSQDLSVALIEARPVHGGRVRAETVRRRAVDVDVDDDDIGEALGEASVGGTWIGQRHTRMLELARDVGMGVERQYFPPPAGGGGGSLSRLVSLLSYEPRPLDEDEYGEMENFVAHLNGIVDSVDVSDVLSLPNAVEYDSLSIEEFVSTRVRSKVVRHEITTFFESVLSSDVSECSFLFALWYLASSGGLEALGDNTPTSNQMYVLKDATAGPSEMCSRLATRLRHAGVTFLRARATSVDYGARDEIYVGTECLLRMKCKRCVLAMNPALAYDTIRFEPELPPEKKKLCRNVLSGHVIKVYLCYEHPFWDDNSTLRKRSGVNSDNVATVNDNGRNLAVSEMFPAKNVFYCKKIGGHHTIVALITGKTCMSVLGKTERQRKELLLNQLCGMYPGVERHIIDRPVAYLEKNWSEDALSGGCFTNGYRSFIGVQSSLHTPINERVFFASSETSDEFCGYMEGALSAGDRVSDMILKSIDSSGTIAK
jgi:monoamine oxidase